MQVIDWSVTGWEAASAAAKAVVEGILYLVRFVIAVF